MSTYPIFSIPTDAREDIEQLGSKPKFWVLLDGDRWLFKEARPNTGEDWAEKVASEVARSIGTEAATVELAEYCGRRGCISLNFVDVKAGEALVHGNEILAMRVTGYDKGKTFGQSHHTLENIQSAIRGLFPHPDADGILSELAGYTVLDALIGNTDRHHENWGLLAKSHEAPRGLSLRLAPSFDHASSLGRELRDERRADLLTADRVGSYLRKGRGGIFRDPEEQHGENPLRFVQVAARAYPKYFRPALERIVTLAPNDVHIIVESLPDTRASADPERASVVNRDPEMSTLFVAWQAPDPTRAWFPIGRLDASTAQRDYVFRYTNGALRAHKVAGFEPLIAFPEFNRRYEANELFPLFKNRILEPNRKDFAEYLQWLDLDPINADPIEILGLTGGERQTDSLEVFPKVRKLTDGTICCRFFLHGLRHVSPAARARAEQLTEGEALQIAIEVNNPATTYAVQLQTSDCHLIGWAPRYLVDDLRAALLDHSTVSATVQRINRLGAPFARRVLVELRGGVPLGFEPMSSDEYIVVGK